VIFLISILKCSTNYPGKILTPGIRGIFEYEVITMKINDLSIGKRLYAGFGIILVILLVLSGMSYVNFAAVNEANGWNEHTYQVMGELDQLLMQMINMETGMRGYALTGEDSFLDPYRNGKDSYAGHLKNVTGLTSDNPKQQEILGKIDKESQSWVTYADSVIATRKAGKVTDVSDASVQGKGKTNFDNFRALVAESRGMESSLLAVRNQKAADDTARTNLILASGTIFAIIVGIIASLFITRGITIPLNNAVLMIQEMNHGKLMKRLHMNQRDEIGIMSQAMDTFADYLQKNVIGTLKQIAAGEKVDLISLSDEKDEIAPALNQMIQTLNALLDEMGILIGEAQEGRLKTRADITKFVGIYKDLIIGINNMLDVVTIPLNEALRVAERYANVDFNARFDDSISVKGDLLQLKERINQVGVHVGTELGSAIKSISEQVGVLTASAEEAAATVEEVTAGASSVAQSSSVVSINAENSLKSVEQVLVAMEELTTSVSTVAAKVDTVSRLTQDANGTSTKGVEQAAVAEKGINAINRSVNDVGTIITEIREQMNEIGKIVEIISNIADQTNLLALNAAIEAARAGDAGMGFAVVANEVKTLAQDSQGSAENIAKIISSLQKQSEKAATAMTEAITEVSKGSVAITDTIRFFHNIAEQVDDISRNMTEVASLSEEEASAVEEITASVSEVKTMANETAKEASSSAASSEESSAALNQVSTIISDLSTIATRINDSVSRLNG